METEQIKEWQQFRENAIAVLKNGSSRPDNTSKFIRLLVLPSFTTSSCFEILRIKNQSNEFIFFQSQWNVLADLEKFRTPIERLKYPRQLSPNIESFSKPASAKFVEKLLGEINAVNLPLQVQTPKFGLDGTEFELTLEGNFWSSRYYWWEQPPAEWKSLGIIANTIKEYSNSLREAEES